MCSIVSVETYLGSPQRRTHSECWRHRLAGQFPSPFREYDLLPYILRLSQEVKKL